MFLKGFLYDFAINTYVVLCNRYGWVLQQLSDKFYVIIIRIINHLSEELTETVSADAINL